METIGSYEAKTHLPALLARVEVGNSFIITRRNVPVAMLTPIPHVSSAIGETIARLRSLRATKKLTLAGLSINELKNEGRP